LEFAAKVFFIHCREIEAVLHIFDNHDRRVAMASPEIVLLQPEPCAIGATDDAIFWHLDLEGFHTDSVGNLACCLPVLDIECAELLALVMRGNVD
jgi:hypothetical protein